MLKRNIQYNRYTDYAYPKDNIKALLSDTLNVTSSKQSTSKSSMGFIVL